MVSKRPRYAVYTTASGLKLTRFPDVAVFHKNDAESSSSNTIATCRAAVRFSCTSDFDDAKVEMVEVDRGSSAFILPRTAVSNASRTEGSFGGVPID